MSEEIIQTLTDDSLLELVCKFLGITVMVNTSVFKIPQMYNILASGSSLGVSLPSVVLEMIGYSGMLTYQFAMQYPLHTYMENTLMVLQDWLLVFVILINRHSLSPKMILYVMVYMIGCVSTAMYWLPDYLMLFAIAMTTPILCWSKIDQLVRIVASGNPGQVSSITWFMISYDTAVRMLTTAVITKDIPMFVNLSSSEVFNISVFFSIIYYNRVKSRGRRDS